MDSFGKIVGVFISVILLFIVPLMYLAQKQDMITQSFVSSKTTEFIDSIKNTGYLSYDMYISYLRQLGATNVVYEVNIVHAHKTVEPIYNEATSSYMIDYNVHYDNRYTQDILVELDRAGGYYFNQGDYISIKVENKSVTYGAKLQHLIFNTNGFDKQIFVAYGGMIRSETN